MKSSGKIDGITGAFHKENGSAHQSVISLLASLRYLETTFFSYCPKVLLFLLPNLKKVSLKTAVLEW
jgi:hypothetical protein